MHDVSEDGWYIDFDLGFFLGSAPSFVMQSTLSEGSTSPSSSY